MIWLMEKDSLNQKVQQNQKGKQRKRRLKDKAMEMMIKILVLKTIWGSLKRNQEERRSLPMASMC